MYFRIADRYENLDNFEEVVQDANQVFKQSFPGCFFEEGTCTASVVVVGYRSHNVVCATLLYRMPEKDGFDTYNIQKFCAFPAGYSSGTTLMQWVLEYISGENKGVVRAWLTVEQPTPRHGIGSFYQQCGFTVVPHDPHSVQHNPGGVFEYHMAYSAG